MLLHAHGVVGVQFERSQSEHEREVGNVRYTDLVLELHVLGTAIVELEAHGDPPEYVALALNEKESE